MRHFHFIRHFLLLAVCVIFSAGSVAFAKEPTKVRVALLKDAAKPIVAIRGHYEIVDFKTKKQLYKGRNLGTCRAVWTKKGIRIWKIDLETDGVLIKSKSKAGIMVNRRRYRGELAILRTKKNGLLVINIVDLEYYIKGVLSHEISPKWPMGALKAQAVAARTYATYQQKLMHKKEYDVTADTSSQLYGGYSAESDRTNRAVNFTQGEILDYEGRVFPAFFHATCGGLTESAAEVWDMHIAPLEGGQVCSYCSTSPHYYWKSLVSLDVIEGKLGKQWRAKKPLEKLVVIDRTPLGRVRTLGFMDASGWTVNMLAKDFRMLMGPDLIRSTNFSITFDAKGHAIFNGKGWGHGVGLCQHGALGMSKEGYNYQEILKFYYPGAKIKKMR